MNMVHAIFWGFVATTILTTLMSAGQGLGLTRMDIPYLMGSMWTPNRDRARRVGFLIHFVNGWVFAFIYILAFRLTGIRTWWFGAAVGLVHAAFLLTAGMSVLPAIHPRMADDQHGPDPTKQLEPPGFLALNYGAQTPIATVVAHLVYGAVLGALYH